MGTDMAAFIEYDEAAYWWQRSDKTRGKEPPPPFAEGNEIRSVTVDGSLYCGSKGYAFFGAIAGVRNDSGIPPLYALRGSPSNLSWMVEGALRDSGHALAGWLTLQEINAALAHHGLERDRVNREVVTLLELMEIMERRYGVNYVRFLFYFD